MRERGGARPHGRHACRPDGSGASGLPALLSVAQGLFYLLTGLWPLVSIRTFQAVTGPKTDLWLVRTVGVLVSVIGGVLTLGGMRRRVAPELGLLAAGSAAGLTGIDVVYSTRGRIAKVYLLDAAAETALVAAWALAWRRSRTTYRDGTTPGRSAAVSAVPASHVSCGALSFKTAPGSGSHRQGR